MRASLVHFAARGYGGSNIRDIAATLGIQAASVYKHFASKEAILAALVFLGYDFHRETILQAVMAADSAPEAQLAALVSAHVRLHCEYPRLSQVTHHEWGHLSQPNLMALARQTDQTNAVLASILRRGMASGAFRIPDSSLAVVSISGLGMSAALWFPYQAEKSAEEVIADFTRTALNMCCFQGVPA